MKWWYLTKIEYEVVADSEDAEEYTSIILKIDGQEFELDKSDVSHLEGIIIAVFDRMVDPFDIYLRQEPVVREAGHPSPYSGTRAR